MSKPATISASELGRIIDDAALFACRDKTLPMINGISFESTPKHLLAVATDRFALGASVANYSEETGEPFSFMLELPRAQMLSKMAKSCKAAFSEVRIIQSDEKVTFEFSSGEALGIPKLVGNWEFPDWRKLVGPKLGEIDATTKAVAVNPTLMAKFGRVHNARQMVVKLTGSNSMMVVKIGDSFVGLIMPVRIDSDALDWTSIEWMARPEPPKKPAAKRTRTPRKTAAKGAA